MQKKISGWLTRDVRRRNLERTLMRNGLADESLLRALEVLDFRKPKARSNVQAFRLYHGLEGEEPMSIDAIATRLCVTIRRVRSSLADTQRRLQNPNAWQDAG